VPAWCCENDRHCASNSAGDGGDGAPAHAKRDRVTGFGGSGRNAAAKARRTVRTTVDDAII
jgi:hypothetical protein